MGEHPYACQNLLTAGFLPVIKNARNNYAELASSGRLPLAIPRPKPRPPAVTKAVPSFVGAVAEPPALHRSPQSAKERWISHSHSMPLLSPYSQPTPDAPRRASAEWLAGSPVAAKSRKRHGT